VQDENEGNHWIRFVHGTTINLWNGDAIVGLGRGDFGAGFYTFEDNRWGRNAASKWARRKAIVAGHPVKLAPTNIPIHVKPILIHVALQANLYQDLRRHDVPDTNLSAAYRQYYPDQLTGNELVVGRVGRNDVNGVRVPDYSLPPQYKFEGAVVAKLATTHITLVS